MVIDEAYYTKLSTTAGLTAIIGTRAYPIFVPQTGSYPCITYTGNVEIRGKSNAGTNGLNKINFETRCWETTEKKAHVLGAALITALKNQSRIQWGTVNVAKCDVESDDEGLDQMIGHDNLLKFATVFTVSVWYMEQ